MIETIMQLLSFVLISALSLQALPKINKEALATLVAFPSAVNVCRATSGVAAIYAIPYDDIDHATGITWDADEQATAVPLVATKTWFTIPFDADTCFFNQEIAQVGRRGIVYNQNITFKMTDDSNDIRKAIKALEGCCDLVFYVVLNNGTTKLGGILPVAAGGTDSRSLQMLSGAGFVNTGADSAADENERQYSFVCRSPEEAPFTTVTQATVIANAV